MSIETDIRASLATALGTAVNGVSVGDLHADMQLPWVTLKRIDTPRRQALGAGRPVISSRPRFQFDVWAETYVLAEPVISLLLPALLALPYDVTLTSEGGRDDPVTGWWHGQIDVMVAHAGA